MRIQRRERAAAKARARHESDAERERVERALERVKKEARECVRSPCQKQRPEHLREKGSPPIHERFGSIKSNRPALINSKKFPPQSPVSDVICVEKSNISTLSTGHNSGICDNGIDSSLDQGANSSASDESKKISIAKEDPDESCVDQTTQYPPYIDPKRNWELSPLKEALKRFILAQNATLQPLPARYPSQNTMQHQLDAASTKNSENPKHRASGNSIMSIISSSDIRLCSKRTDKMNELKNLEDEEYSKIVSYRMKDEQVQVDVNSESKFHYSNAAMKASERILLSHTIVSDVPDMMKETCADEETKHETKEASFLTHGSIIESDYSSDTDYEEQTAKGKHSDSIDMMDELSNISARNSEHSALEYQSSFLSED